MPITVGGKTYSDEDVRQFYANGGDEATFARQNGLSDAETQAAMSQARGIAGSGSQSHSREGVNSVDYDKGVFSPVENRWISNDEIKSYFASNPNASANQINELAGKLGLNPYSISYAAWQGTGGGDPRYNQKYMDMSSKLAQSQWNGASGYGTDFDAANRAGTNALTPGAGNTQYLMPDGSYYSVRMHNNTPDETYEQALKHYNDTRTPAPTASAGPRSGQYTPQQLASSNGGAGIAPMPLTSGGAGQSSNAIPQQLLANVGGYSDVVAPPVGANGNQVAGAPVGALTQTADGAMRNPYSDNYPTPVGSIGALMRVIAGQDRG